MTGSGLTTTTCGVTGASFLVTLTGGSKKVVTCCNRVLLGQLTRIIKSKNGSVTRLELVILTTERPPLITTSKRNSVKK